MAPLDYNLLYAGLSAFRDRRPHHAARTAAFHEVTHPVFRPHD